MIEALTPKFSKKIVKVVGCGLAGAELAFILANNGFIVHIFDNKKNKPKTSFDYYQKYQNFMTENMEYELDCLCSPLLSIAKKFGFENFGKVYDEEFMLVVRKELEKHPNIQIFDGNITELNLNETMVLATGHNTDKALLKEIEKIVGSMRICYFQPQNMIIDANSVDLKKLNFVSENECYANFNEDEYFAILDKVKAFDDGYEKDGLQENQITIEAIAMRGKQALRNAVFRPHFNEKAKVYASLKMRYNPYHQILVLDDICSALDEDEQEEIIHSIPALSNCKIVQFCKVLKRTSLISPACLDEHLRISENIYVCGGFAGTAGSFEGLLMANFCAYRLICDISRRFGANLLLENTCMGRIHENLLKKSVIKFRLFSLKYDIIDTEDMKKFRKEIEIQKILSKSQVEKFKEKFYGKYF